MLYLDYLIYGILMLYLDLKENEFILQLECEISSSFHE